MLSHPLWLSGLLALGIPLALHLWSQRPGRVLRVGSTRHLTDLPPVHRFSLRLTERLLLALRLGVLAALVLALADPRLTTPAPTGATPIVLVSREVAADSGVWLTDRWLDSLGESGAPLTLLAAGFPTLDRGQPLPETADEAPLWDRVAEADRRLPAGRPFVVVASGRLSTLGTARPRLSRPVTWHATVPEAPTWTLAAAWSVGQSDSIALWLREGDTLGSREHRLTIGSAAGVHRTGLGPAVEVRGEGAARGVRLLAADAESTAVTVAAVRPLAIALPEWSAADTRRLELAAQVVGEALGQPVVRAAVPDSADLTLAMSIDAAGRQRLLVPAAWLPLPTLPDSLLQRWPLPTPPRAASDPRVATLTQLQPAMLPGGAGTTKAPRHLRLPLLWLALTLLAMERLLAARPRRSA